MILRIFNTSFEFDYADKRFHLMIYTHDFIMAEDIKRCL